jgi:hypothetical protein
VYEYGVLLDRAILLLGATGQGVGSVRASYRA